MTPGRASPAAETRRVVRRFAPYLQRHRLLVGGSLGALLAEVCLKALEPIPLKVIFDHVIAPPAAAPPSVLDSLTPLMLLAVTAAALIAIVGLRALASYASTVGFALIGNRVLTEVRNDLYRHLQRLSLAFHARARSGDLLLRVSRDVDMLKEVTVTAALPLLGNVAILVVTVTLMFVVHARLALVAVAMLPLFWLAMSRGTRHIREAARMQRRREGSVAATTAESLGAIKTVQVLSLEGRFASAFGRQNDRTLLDDVRAKRLAAGLERRVDVLLAVVTAFALGYGAYLVSQAELTGGELLVFLAYLKMSFRPLQDLAKYTARLARATAAGERVMELLDQVPDVHDCPGAVPAPAFSGDLRFDGVRFAYEDGAPVLDGVELHARPGQHVAIIGTSGSGKSTLASLLLRLYDPHDGRVLIDGEDIRRYTLESLRAQISVVLQEPLLFAASVRENIAYGAPDVGEDAIIAAARLANAHGFISALPQGYDTVLGERGVTLSAGQRQRIAIARSAVRRSPIVVLDEPVTGMDGENERAVLDALARLTRGRTTILITHDLRQAARADLVIHLERGRVTECGTHSELLRARGRYASLFTAQTSAPARPKETHAASR
ncbi:MAG: ABC transporter ATP-binding protein/permease [Gemmatimonadota bacterium]|nr:ABC transporter ATP-binding protein/permease [Gemmatimonadota bacterium]